MMAERSTQQAVEQDGQGGSAALGRALSILEYLADEQAPRGLTEIAEHVGGPKATIHRIMSTLTARGYLRQNSQSAYLLGIRCFELGSKWQQGLDLRSVAAPHLITLNQETEETAVLAVYESGSVVYIDKVMSPQPVIATTQLGHRSPADRVATGRALLAYAPTEELQSVLPDSSESASADLGEMLHDVRANGYAVTQGSYRPGVSGVGCPIRDYTGMVVAALGLTVPSDRFSQRKEVLVATTLEHAKAISAELGGYPAFN